MDDLDEIAHATGFSGVVRVGDETRAYGLADRAHGIPNEPGTQFAIASGAKTLTALAVVALVQDGVLELGTPARAHLGSDLPLVGDDVTIEHLLAHRSGIGDYLDEDIGVDIEAYVLPVPAQQLAATEDYLAVLEGHPRKFAPGERFAYCNSGYVVLALLAERASGIPFHELVEQRVSGPAEMRDTAFLRSDELPGRAAIGYVGDRTNVFNLPVRGSGDGGIYTTLDDVFAFWRALYAGAIVAPDWVAEMTGPRSTSGNRRYGLGFWLHPDHDAVVVEGADAGVSFRSTHRPSTNATYAVVSNTTSGAWPLARHLEQTLIG